MKITLILLAVIAVLLVGWSFILQPKSQTPVLEESTSTESSTTPANAMRQPRATESTVFDPADTVVGDRYGDFVVTKAYYQPSEHPYPYDTYAVYFEGTTTFTGVITGTPEMCDWAVGSIPTSTDQKIPHLDSHLPHWMYLNFGHLPGQDFTLGDTVEVTINQFIGESVPKDCGGDTGYVSSFKKI